MENIQRDKQTDRQGRCNCVSSPSGLTQEEAIQFIMPVLHQHHIKNINPSGERLFQWREGEELKMQIKLMFNQRQLLGEKLKFLLLR